MPQTIPETLTIMTDIDDKAIDYIIDHFNAVYDSKRPYEILATQKDSRPCAPNGNHVTFVVRQAKDETREQFEDRIDPIIEFVRKHLVHPAIDFGVLANPSSIQPSDRYRVLANDYPYDEKQHMLDSIRQDREFMQSATKKIEAEKARRDDKECVCIIEQNEARPMPDEYGDLKADNVDSPIDFNAIRDSMPSL